MRTQRDRMVAGELYEAMDPELIVARGRARDLCLALNATGPGDAQARQQLARQLFAAGGDTVELQPPFFCDYGSNIELGEAVFFNFNCVVLDVCPVRIGAGSLIGPGVQILTPLHPLDRDRRRRLEYGRPVDIGADVWIGGGAIVCPGVRVGAGSVIGAGSVVTRDIPDGVLAYGNPCRVARAIGDDERDLRDPGMRPGR